MLPPGALLRLSEEGAHRSGPGGDKRPFVAFRARHDCRSRTGIASIAGITRVGLQGASSRSGQQPNAQQRRRREGRRDVEHRKFRARPLDAQALDDPERPEGGQEHAGTELHRVLGDAGERAVDDHPEKGDQYHGDPGTREGDPVGASDDGMNGGPNRDFIDGFEGDILRCQEGSEHGDTPQSAFMFGDPGNGKLYGWPGEDAMQGEEGTDEHYGGDNNDFIDSVSGDTPGTRDLVDCGSGFDTAVVNREEDIVRGNCENVDDVATTTTRVAQPAVTTDEDQQQIKDAFLQEHGLAPEPTG
jgi:hypothetical protein